MKILAAHLVIVLWRKAQLFCCCVHVQRPFAPPLLAFLSQIAHCRPFACLFHCVREFVYFRFTSIFHLYFLFLLFFVFLFLCEESKNPLVSSDLVLLFALKRSLCISVFSWVFHIRGTPSRIDSRSTDSVFPPHYIRQFV